MISHEVVLKESAGPSVVLWCITCKKVLVQPELPLRMSEWLRVSEAHHNAVLES